LAFLDWYLNDLTGVQKVGADGVQLFDHVGVHIILQGNAIQGVILLDAIGCQFLRLLLLKFNHWDLFEIIVHVAVSFFRGIIKEVGRFPIMGFVLEGNDVVFGYFSGVNKKSI